MRNFGALMKTVIKKSVGLIIASSLIISGTVTGNIKFDGKTKKKSIRTDAECGNIANKKGVKHLDEKLVVNDGNFQNVLVWIDYKGPKKDIPKDKVVIDQLGCVYSPHVFGIQMGQELLIKNSDPVLHNVHSKSKSNPEFNFAMPSVVKEKTHKFKKTEDPFYIKCDVHAWMKSWVGVFDHPYFAVTDSKGNYKIENVPEGSYEVVAWQEKFGMKRVKKQKISVSDGFDGNHLTKANFKFSPPKRKKK